MLHDVIYLLHNSATLTRISPGLKLQFSVPGNFKATHARRTLRHARPQEPMPRVGFDASAQHFFLLLLRSLLQLKLVKVSPGVPQVGAQSRCTMEPRPCLVKLPVRPKEAAIVRRQSLNCHRAMVMMTWLSFSHRSIASLLLDFRCARCSNMMAWEHQRAS